MHVPTTTYTKQCRYQVALWLSGLHSCLTMRSSWALISTKIRKKLKFQNSAAVCLILLNFKENVIQIIKMMYKVSCWRCRLKRSPQTLNFEPSKMPAWEKINRFFLIFLIFLVLLANSPKHVTSKVEKTPWLFLIVESCRIPLLLGCERPEQSFTRNTASLITRVKTLIECNG